MPLSSFSICGKIMVQVFFQMRNVHEIDSNGYINKFYIADRSKNNLNL